MNKNLKKKMKKKVQAVILKLLLFILNKKRIDSIFAIKFIAFPISSHLTNKHIKPTLIDSILSYKKIHLI